MPTVSELFKTYKDFASASLTDIYGDRLKNAYKVTANHLQSGVWINESTKDNFKMRWQDFPWLAQLSPTNAIVSGDFNGDGNVEIILAQNHHTNQVETGLWRGSPGCHLEWRDGKFEAITHTASGIVMPNDTKDLMKIDADGDGKDDVMAAQNNGPLLLFKNTAEKKK